MKDLLLSNRNKQFIDTVGSIGSGSLGILGPIGSGKGTYAHQIYKILTEKLDYRTGEGLLVLDVSLGDVGIAELRELQSKLSFKANRSENASRVVIIENFDLLKSEAQNAMLKTLEEPPKSTLIILTFSDIYRVLPTILSRLNIVHIDSVNLDMSLQYYTDLDNDDVKKAHLISGGLAGLQHNLLHDSQHELVTGIEKAKEILQMDKFSRLAKVDKLSKTDRNETLVLLNAISKLLYALHRQVLSKTTDKKLINISLKRLQLVADCQRDVSAGLNQKLALTRLFIAL